MDLNCIVNFTKICRCCKRTEPGMTSIFDGNAHPTDHTYPPVKEMLRSIASLNVQENDGLPSLVCTSCLNNIQDAFTFILQVIQINEELSQMLATGKQDDTLPALSQSTFETNQYILTDFVKNESEDVNLSLKVEDLDDPMLNFYQHGSAVSSYANIDLVVKLEQLDQDAAGNVDDPAAVESDEISNLADPLYHASDEEKDISLVKEYTCSGNENLSVNDGDYLLLVQNSEEMEDFEDMDDMGVDEEYQVDVEEANSIHSSDDTVEVQTDVDYQEKNEDGNSVDSSDSSRKLRTIRQKTNLLDAPLFRCKLCAYSNPNMSNLKMHLQTHFDLEPFICSKCNGTFTRRTNLLRHRQRCNGKISIYAINARHGQHRRMTGMRAMTLQEFEDPKKIKEFYTEVQVQQNNDNDADEEIEKTSSKLPMLKCNLCAFSNANMSNLRRHLLTHSKDKPSFTCTKCKLTFSRNDYMQRHRQKCNGEISKYALNARQIRYREKGRGLKEVQEDESEIKEYYTEIDVQINDRGGDEETSNASKVTQSKMFKCKLCTFTHKNMCSIKQHLNIHFKQKPFACSKCKLRFTRDYYMQRHFRSCNGGYARFDRNARGPKPLKRLVALTLQDIRNPERMKEFYTKIDDDEFDVKVKSTEDGCGGDDAEIGESSKLAPKRPMLKCKLCDFTNAYMSDLKRHLLTHSTEQPYACSKCNQAFSRKYYMQRHSRSCNGEISKYALNARKVRNGNGKGPKQVLTLSLQDLENPEKIEELCTEDGGDDEDVEIGEPTSTTVLKCNLCSYTNAYMSNIKRHLLAHSKEDKSFECSKCNMTFTRQYYMRRHSRKCNGEISKYALNARQVKYRGNGRGPKQVVALTLNDLNDELKMKEYYTEIVVQNNDDNAEMQQAKDAGDDVENEETSKRTVFKCTLCAYTNSDGYLSNLRRHLQTHSVNRPFTCSNCNASFAQKDYFKRHLGICKAGIVEQWRQNGGHVRHRGSSSRHVLTLTPQDLEDSNKVMTYFTKIDEQNSQDDDDDLASGDDVIIKEA